MHTKYLVILGDGMADEPLEVLGGKTPLEHARTPNMDQIARDGCCGLLRTIPDGYEAGSDIANLSILGYDPRHFYTGRGPLEAASIGIPLEGSDMAYRCNLSTVVDGVMADFSAGHISSAEGSSLIDALDTAISPARAYPGVSYRNLLVLRAAGGAVTVPPHDIVGQEIAPHLPAGDDAPLLIQCMKISKAVFAGHRVNRDRISRGLPPATQIWPWSGGRSPALTLFSEKYRKRGGIISAVDLLKGIGRCAGMEIIEVPGATGYLDTDYQAKARYALQALQHLDFVYVHVEAPDEAGHLGSVPEKVAAIERLDEMIGTIMDDFAGVIGILPDHPTPIRVRTHTGDPVPFAILGHTKDTCRSFSEKEASFGKYGVLNGYEFLPLLFQDC